MHPSTFCFLAGFVLGAAPLEGDLKKVQGTWEYIKVEVKGKEVERDDVKELRIVVQGDKYTVTRDSQVITEGRLHFQGDKNKPKRVDATPGDGEYKGQELPGIYELKGDTWTMCFSAPGKPRPADFRAGAGDLMRYEMKRVKK